MKPSEIFSYLRFAITNREPVLVVGTPGIGKTDIIEQVCQDLKARLIVSHPVTSDPTDLKGIPALVTENGEQIAKFLPFNDLYELVTAKELTVFFLDDLGQAPQSVQAAAMQLFLARRINGHILSDNVVILAATNRREDQAGVQGILEPLKGRTTIIHLTPDEEDWFKWARSKGLPEELIAFVNWRKYEGRSVLYEFKPSKDMSNSPTPRNIASCGIQMLKGLPKNLEFEVFMGRVGEGVASEICHFLTICRELPDPEWVIANPEKAKIPTKPDIKFALISSIIGRAKKENFDNIIKFANRLENEFSVLLVKNCVSKNPSLSDTSSKLFTEWCLLHREIILL